MTSRTPKESRPPCVLALGSIGVDFHATVDQSPEIGKSVSATSFQRLGGGKAANAAFIASKLGADAKLFAHVGDDDLAEYALRPLREAGVNLTGVEHVRGAQTGVSMITVTPDGKKGFVTAPHANQCWGEADTEDVILAIRKAWSGSAFLVDCEVPMPVVEAAMRVAHDIGRVIIILDPSPAERVTDSLLSFADIVTPNAREAHALTGFECKDVASAVRAGNRLGERGAWIACIKLPEGGCVTVSRDRAQHIAAVPVKVVDTTGAGDAFAGALAVALSEGQSCWDAARFAVAASTLAITSVGAQPAFPSRKEVERMMRQLAVSDVTSAHGS